MLQMDCLAHKNVDKLRFDDDEIMTAPTYRHAMHVQSISHWAPANIGPYSQAVQVGIHSPSPPPSPPPVSPHAMLFSRISICDFIGGPIIGENEETNMFWCIQRSQLRLITKYCLMHVI